MRHGLKQRIRNYGCDKFQSIAEYLGIEGGFVRVMKFKYWFFL